MLFYLYFFLTLWDFVLDIPIITNTEANRYLFNTRGKKNRKPRIINDMLDEMRTRDGRLLYAYKGPSI